jgi:hypothetical protein
VSADPGLCWKQISSSDHNAWNDVFVMGALHQGFLKHIPLLLDKHGVGFS